MRCVYPILQEVNHYGGAIITGVVANAVLIMMAMFVITVVNHLTNIKYGNDIKRFFYVKGDDVMEQEEIIKRLVEWTEEENKKAQALDAFRNSQVHFNLKNRVGEKDYTMSEEQWKRFRQGWESYGVKFQNDDGTYKYTEDVLNEMAIVWRNLGENDKDELNMF